MVRVPQGQKLEKFKIFKHYGGTDFCNSMNKHRIFNNKKSCMCSLLKEKYWLPQNLKKKIVSKKKFKKPQNRVLSKNGLSS